MRKGIKIMMVPVLAFLLGTCLVASAQAPMTEIDKGGKMPNKALDESKVPLSVKQQFTTDYPMVKTYYWYGYPAIVDSSWTDYDSQSYVTEGPIEYYVTEYVVNEVPSKTVYSKSGKKVSTHKSVKDHEIPVAVTNAIKKGKYSGWKIASEKEELMKDSDKKKLYKVIVEKSGETHVLCYDASGKLIKDKKKM